MLLFDQLGDRQRQTIASIGPKMDVTNVADYFYHHARERWLLKDFPQPRPPFKNMWAEYRFPRTTYSKEMGTVQVKSYGEGFTPYFGCFISEELIFKPNDKYLAISNFTGNVSDLPDGTGVKILDNTSEDAQPGKYGLYGGTWYIDNRQRRVIRYGSEVSLRFDIGDDGAVSHTYLGGTILDRYRDDPSKVQAELEERVYFLYPILMAFSFSNCKNIEVVDVEPPAKLNKARVRRGNRPLVTYKVINVLPFGKSYKPSARAIRSDGQGVAVHIRAGNFAHYGEAYGRKKLFGKYEGMFWRPQSAPGSAAHGVSVHDYEARAK